MKVYEKMTHCCCLGWELEASKYVGECFESWIFDIQLLRYVLDILWCLLRILHLNVRISLIGYVDLDTYEHT